MSKQSGMHRFALVMAAALVFGCGDFNDDVAPTPSPAPTSTPDPNAPPTPTPSCGGTGGVPGCRDFSWVQNLQNNVSPSGFFTTVALVGNVGNAGLTFKLGSFFLRAEPPDADGVSEVSMIGPPQSATDPHLYFFTKLLVDAQCIRFYPETASGQLYCNGRVGQGVDTSLLAPSGTFPRDQPRDQVLETGLGDSAPPGAFEMRIDYQQMRTSEGENSDPNFCLVAPDCPPGQAKDCYEPILRGALTTGTAFAQKGETILQLPTMAGQPPPPPGITGEPFDCATWQVEDGPGRLVLGLVDYDDGLVGDTAAAVRWADTNP